MQHTILLDVQCHWAFVIISYVSYSLLLAYIHMCMYVCSFLCIVCLGCLSFFPTFSKLVCYTHVLPCTCTCTWYGRNVLHGLNIFSRYMYFDPLTQVLNKHCVFVGVTLRLCVCVCVCVCDFSCYDNTDTVICPIQIIIPLAMHHDPPPVSLTLCVPVYVCA